MVRSMATPLAERHCEVCKPGTPTLTEAEVAQLEPDVPDWEVTDVDGHRVLKRTFRFKGFMPGVALVNDIAKIAEAEGHHPDLDLRYGSLTVSLWTHAAGGLTNNDFILAAKIDRIAPNQGAFTRS
jgi:4a-hydroxytetrahydrobiopterin dehydratase